MVTRGEALKYAILPRIIPRLFAIFRGGFSHIAYLMAIVYNIVKLIPNNHPYLDPQNLGRFGIRHVISAAANNLEFKTKNLDQIFIFFLTIAGLFLLIAQVFILIGIVLLEQPAVAAALTATNMLSNPSPIGSLGPEQDLAFIILDRVFGVSGMFNSCISTTATCLQINGFPVADGTAGAPFPWPYHVALHNMLEFYSIGIFLVSVFIIIYFIITVIGETATSGTPFGQRFNRTWVPVRIIVFAALLLPLPGGPVGAASDRLPGMNGAQIITLHIARMGSNFATNSWAYFNAGPTITAADGTLLTAASANRLSQQKELIAQPEIQRAMISDVIQFIHIAKTCQQAYHQVTAPDDIRIDAYVVRNEPLPAYAAPVPPGIANPNRLDFGTTAYQLALEHSGYANITIRFGEAYDTNPPSSHPSPIPKRFKVAKGEVIPYCGEMIIPIQDVTQPGSQRTYEEYYNLVQEMWVRDPDIQNTADCMVKLHATIASTTCTQEVNQNFVQTLMERYGPRFQQALENGILEQKTNGNFGVDNSMLRMGWVGVSIYYNLIAEANGAVTAASMAIPYKGKLPLLMDIALMKNRMQNAGTALQKQFKNTLSDATGQNMSIDLTKDENKERLRPMDIVYADWIEVAEPNTDNFQRPTGNAVLDFFNNVLGTSGLYDMRDNTDVHPLAQLSTLGKGMMDATIRNAAIATAGALTGSSLNILNDFVGDSAKLVKDFLFTMVMVTIGIATILYYILPMLPFIYFIFAVSGWIKSIFEAIVAMPLWALAHLRIDGEGLPGPGATNGYFLLLEIFLRPTLIVIGFIAGVSIFSALVVGLNLVFDLVVANVGGFDVAGDAVAPIGSVAGAPALLELSRSAVDEFFFTAMYAIICYMMGLSCFKLVDLVPNKILRWAGVSIPAFQENAGDPASQLTNRVYKGSILIGNQLTKDKKTDLAALMQQ